MLLYEFSVDRLPPATLVGAASLNVRSLNRTVPWLKLKTYAAAGDEQLPICGSCQRGNRYCEHLTELRFRHHNVSEQVDDIPGNVSPLAALKDDQTANLFHHYCTHLAPWYDLSDSERSFQSLVPQVALSRPLLFSAIMAFAVIHRSRTKAASLLEIGQTYHSDCLRRLIALKSTDGEMTNGTALAAVCLLRSYEILAEDFDPNRHLSGAYALAANGAVDFAGPSLFRAGFFNYLREDITYSLMTRRALKVDVADFPRDLTPLADEDQLNVASLFVAVAINRAFGISDEDNGYDLRSLQQWKERLKPAFEPFSQTYRDGTFPHIWMLRDCHTSTLQYYWVAASLFKATEPLSEESLDDLDTNATKVCGLTFTSGSIAVLINSFGPISYCCRFLRSQSLRNELQRRLRAARKDTGWPVQRMIDELTACWDSST